MHADACYPHRRGSRSPSEVHEHTEDGPMPGQVAEVDGATIGPPCNQMHQEEVKSHPGKGREGAWAPIADYVHGAQPP